MIINTNKHEGSRPKCYFTSSALPEFIDHNQIPVKKRPFCTISQHHFSHTVNLVLPDARAEDFKGHVEKAIGALQYAQVYMKLSEVIEGEFFNHYIKSGNILMLSSGRTGLDNLYSLCEGILRLEVDKATYERMGLGGIAIASGGRKHVKTRYAVELNLRLPSMVRAKHGFERIVWAFKNVLNETLTWLFYDLNGKNDGSGPIAQHQPKMKSIKPELQTMNAAKVPELSEEIQNDDHHTANELLEWLSLATMCSPRIQSQDKIDRYLSRYQVPGSDDLDSATITHDAQDLVRLRWHGFIPSTFIKNIVLASLKAAGDSWFGLTVATFDGKAYSVLQRKHYTMTWEYTV